MSTALAAAVGLASIPVNHLFYGEEQGRPRVKLCHWDELLAAARSTG